VVGLYSRGRSGVGLYVREFRVTMDLLMRNSPPPFFFFQILSILYSISFLVLKRLIIGKYGC